VLHHGVADREPIWTTSSICPWNSFWNVMKTLVFTYLLLLQSALQPLWVLACSTIVEYSQQEGFYRVPLPADQWLERSNSRHQVSPTPETTRTNPSSGRWNYWREMAENFAEEGVLRIFSPEKSDGFGRVWTRELWYQRPARLPLDHRSRCIYLSRTVILT